MFTEKNINLIVAHNSKLWWPLLKLKALRTFQFNTLFIYLVLNLKRNLIWAQRLSAQFITHCDTLIIKSHCTRLHLVRRNSLWHAASSLFSPRWQWLWVSKIQPDTWYCESLDKWLGPATRAHWTKHNVYYTLICCRCARSYDDWTFFGLRSLTVHQRSGKTTAISEPSPSQSSSNRCARCARAPK